jgi:RNA polymerase sigma factor (sigma-70 family)
MPFDAVDFFEAPQAPSGFKTWTQLDINNFSERKWEAFFFKYRPYIIMMAKKKKLNNEAIYDLIAVMDEEIVDNGIVEKYTSEKGRFRDYLGRIIRNKCVDIIRKRQRLQKQAIVVPFDEDNKKGLDLIEENDSWRKIWQKYIFSQAVEKLKEELSNTHYQIFELYAMKGHKAAEVAKFLNETEDNVYAVCSRVTKKLKIIVDQLCEEQPLESITEDGLPLVCQSAIEEIAEINKEFSKQ